MPYKEDKPVSIPGRARRREKKTETFNRSPPENSRTSRPKSAGLNMLGKGTLSSGDESDSDDGFGGEITIVNIDDVTKDDDAPNETSPSGPQRRKPLNKRTYPHLVNQPTHKPYHAAEKNKGNGAPVVSKGMPQTGTRRNERLLTRRSHGSDSKKISQDFKAEKNVTPRVTLKTKNTNEAGRKKPLQTQTLSPREGQKTKEADTKEDEKGHVSQCQVDSSANGKQSVSPCETEDHGCDPLLPEMQYTEAASRVLQRLKTKNIPPKSTNFPEKESPVRRGRTERRPSLPRRLKPIPNPSRRERAEAEQYDDGY